MSATENIYGDSTNIEYSSVEQKVQKIESDSDKIGEIFDSFTDSMNEVYKPDNFSGEASDELQEMFKRLKENFNAYRQLVDDFANAIRTAKEQTQGTEKDIQNDASNLA